MNPAIDLTIAVDRLAFDDRAYILSSKDSPGGRGINAAYVIHSFLAAKTSSPSSPPHGDRGARFEHYMLDCGFPIATVPIRNDIRLNFTIVDRHGLDGQAQRARSAPRTRRAVEPSKAPSKRNWPNASWLMLCGSLPPGVPADFYAQLIARAKKRGVKTLLDADGEALSRGVEAGPTVVTPNQQEAERLLGTVLLTRSHALAAVRRIRAMGAESVVLSLGSRGAIGAVHWQGADQLWEAAPPRVEAISPIGAGDALAAALTWSLHNGDDFPEALSWGVAAGSASAQLPGTSFATLDQAAEIMQ